MPTIRVPRWEDDFVPPVCVVTGETDGVLHRRLQVSDGKVALVAPIVGHSLATLAVNVAANAAWGRDPVHVALPFTESAYRSLRRAQLLEKASLYLAGATLVVGLPAAASVRSSAPWLVVTIIAAIALPVLAWLVTRGRTVAVLDGEGPEIELEIPSEKAALAVAEAWAAREARRATRKARGAGRTLT